MKKLTYRGDGKLENEEEITNTSHSPNAQWEDKLPLYRYVASSENLLAINRVLSQSNLSTFAKEGIYKLIHTEVDEAKEQARQELLDELEAAFGTMDMTATRGTQITLDFIQSKRTQQKEKPKDE